MHWGELRYTSTSLGSIIVQLNDSSTQMSWMRSSLGCYKIFEIASGGFGDFYSRVGKC